MTREEAVKRIKSLRTKIDEPTDTSLGWLESFIYKGDVEALDMAIKALEQEPCEDAISRKAVLDIVRFEKKWLFDARSNNADTDIAFGGIIATVKDLPPVTPTRKVGKWITDVSSGMCYCSRCGFGKSQLANRWCAACGADMRGVEDDSN